MTAEEVKQIIAATAERFSPGADPSGLFSIAKRESAFNPAAMGDGGTSYGLYQLKPEFYLRLFDASASPSVLLNPYVATLIAMRLWNRAIELGARNPVQVRLIWAYGTNGVKKYPPGSPEYDSRLVTESKRFASLGYPASYAERSAAAFGYGGAGTGPSATQNAQLASLLGAVVTPQHETETESGNYGLIIGLGILGIGTIAWISSRKK